MKQKTSLAKTFLALLALAALSGCIAPGFLIVPNEPETITIARFEQQIFSPPGCFQTVRTADWNHWVVPPYIVLMPPSDVNVEDYYFLLGDGNSMFPSISSGQRVLVKKVFDTNELFECDVVAFRNYEGRLILHRIVSIGFDANGWFAVTKGDNNDGADGYVRASSIEAVQTI